MQQTNLQNPLSPTSLDIGIFKTIVVLETEDVQDSQVFFCRNASYLGSTPFHAIFEVWDVEHALTVDPLNGTKKLSVHCQWGEDTTKDSILEIDLADVLPHAGEGYCGQVVRRITWG
jgi:hypothetical protein